VPQVSVSWSVTETNRYVLIQLRRWNFGVKRITKIRTSVKIDNTISLPSLPDRSFTLCIILLMKLKFPPKDLQKQLMWMLALDLQKQLMWILGMMGAESLERDHEDF